MGEIDKSYSVRDNKVRLKSLKGRNRVVVNQEQEVSFFDWSTIIIPYWATPENIHTHPLWTTLNWVPENFRISKKDSSSLCRIPNPADSKSWGIPEFCKILNGFAGIPVKIHKILGKFMEFQSRSPSIYCRICNVVHGVCGYFLEEPIIALRVIKFIRTIEVKYEKK